MGLTKISSQPKQPWALLTVDSDLSHAAQANTLQVDSCTGWSAGDEIVVTATGGDTEKWGGFDGVTESQASCFFHRVFTVQLNPQISVADLTVNDELLSYKHYKLNGNGKADSLVSA